MSTTEIVEFNPVEAGLEALRVKYADVAFDLRSTKGNAEARAARRDLVSLRTGLEAKRKELKEPILERAKLIDAEAKRIAGELLKLEQPIDDAIKADELRRERERKEREAAEARRVAKIEESIRSITATALRAVGKPSAAIADEIEALQAFEIGEDYDEYKAGAQAAKDAALAQLQTLHGAALANENEAARLAAEREEFARQQAEAKRLADEQAAAEQERLARIEAERQAQEREARERAALQERIDNQARIDREAKQAAIEAENARVAAANAAEAARIQAEREELSRRMQAEEDQRQAAAEAARVAEVDRIRSERHAKIDAASVQLVKHPGSFISRRVLPAESPIEALTPAPTRDEILFAITERWGVSTNTANRWIVQLWANEVQS